MSKSKVCLLIALITLGLSPNFSYSQKSDLNFLVEKIKIDYPGFKEKIKTTSYNKLIGNSIRKNGNDTFRTMAEITDFFKDPHLQLIHSKSIVDTAKCISHIDSVHNYFSTAKHLKKMEGFWLNDYNDCVMAIRLTKSNPQKFIGYIIESRDSSILYPGMTMCDFSPISKINKQEKIFTKLTSPFSGTNFFVWSEFKNDSMLLTGAYGKWRKLQHYNKPIINSLPVYNNRTTCELIDKSTVLITIPENTRENSDILDSILTVNDTKIRSRPNLIIDLRNNLGGNMGPYYLLVPYVYTDPIAEIAGYRYCTRDEINIDQKRLDSYMKTNNPDSAIVNNWKERIGFKIANIGKLIETPPDTTVLDSVTIFPKNVGIIVNYACLSSTEMMLLNFKQSKKVKVFGEHTGGAVDYLDFYSLEFPSKRYKIKMPTAKRKILMGGSKLDGIGIYPDVPIADSIPNWIKFVKEYYEKH